MRKAGVFKSSCWPDLIDQINAITNPMDMLKLNPIMRYIIAIGSIFSMSQISNFEVLENMISIMILN